MDEIRGSQRGDRGGRRGLEKTNPVAVPVAYCNIVEMVIWLSSTETQQQVEMDLSSVEPGVVAGEAVQLKQNGSCGRHDRLLKVDFERQVAMSGEER